MSTNSISVIVPVFNGEKYLRACIDSVIAQNNDNWELILVNDGSTDNSGTICREYAKNDNRVIYIEKQNEGVSVARNVAIEKATKEWITFLDADDMLAPFAFDILNTNTENADMVVFSYSSDENKLVLSDNKRYLSSEDIRMSILNFPKFKRDYPGQKAIDGYNRWSCWGRFYKTAILKNFTFTKGIKLGEDLLFCYSVLGKIEKVLLNDSNAYYYRINAGSVSQRFRDDRITNTVKLIENLKSYIAYDNMDLFNHFVIDRVSACVFNYFADKRNPKSKQERVKELKTFCTNSVVSDAIRNCGYNDINIGKKNIINSEIVLFLLKRNQYNLLLFVVESILKRV